MDTKRAFNNDVCVVVIDDSCRFPLYVWRYLSRSLGFGIGGVGRAGRSQYEDSDAEPWLQAGVSSYSDDGRFELLWIPAGKDGEKEVEKKVKSTVGGLIFLVDVHGDPEYDSKEVAQCLDGSSVEWYLVSAYYSEGTISGKVALPKSRETLEKIREQVWGRPKVKNRNSRIKGVCHLLVTGAGFERKAERGGFGLPGTDVVLYNMDYPFTKKRDGGEGRICIDTKRNNDSGFPLLSFLSQGEWKELVEVQGAAKGKDLDSYWDLLLSHEQRRRLAPAAGSERDDQKVDAVIWETKLREAFRNSLLNYDWGHMNQSLAAACLGWLAWMTTNYTQFANRAISASACKDHWRIISTAAEARLTMREIRRNPGKDVQDETRYMFKLHGDIGHLHTMAIAGHDKEVFSPLSTPVEDLYQVYEAAHGFLIDSLGKQKGMIVWHIVGHGMQDKRLRELLGRVCRQARNQHLFLLVDPEPEAPKKLLSSSVGENAVHAVPLRAGAYMAHLERAGLPRSPKAAWKWLRTLESLADTGGSD